MEFRPAAMTSGPTPGCTNSCASFWMTGSRTSGGVRSCTDWARATRMEVTRSWWYVRYLRERNESEKFEEGDYVLDDERIEGKNAEFMRAHHTTQ